MNSSQNEVQLRIWRQIIQPHNKSVYGAIPVYINSVRYSSCFEAGIDSELSFPSIVNNLKKSGGAPVKIKGVIAVREEWLLRHPEYLFCEAKK